MMGPLSVLARGDRDPRELTLEAREAYVLAQLDGVLTIDEVATIAGVAVPDTLDVAARLVELGAARLLSMNTGRHSRVVVPPPAAPAKEPSPPRRESKPASVRNHSVRPPPASTRRPAVTSSRKSLPPSSARTPSRPASSPAPAASRSAPAPKPAVSAPAPAASAPTPVASAPAPVASAPASVASAPAPAPAPSDPPSSQLRPYEAPDEPERARKLLAQARTARDHERVTMLRAAADDALAKGDVVTAETNLRLALEHVDDAATRIKLEEVDKLARGLRLERSLARARDAEKEVRWADAASHYEKAYAIRRDAAVAERIAFTLLAAGGEPSRAVDHARQAVAMRERNAEFHATLAEAFHAAGSLEEARASAQKALDLCPGLARAVTLLGRLSRKSR